MRDLHSSLNQSFHSLWMGPIFNLANSGLILIGRVVLHFFLFLLAGTILDVVFVGCVDVVVIVVVAVAVVVATLFPLFIFNHAQDHLAHLLTERNN